MKMLRGFAFFVMIALVPAIVPTAALAQHGHGGWGHHHGWGHHGWGHHGDWDD